MDKRLPDDTFHNECLRNYKVVQSKADVTQILPHSHSSGRGSGSLLTPSIQQKGSSECHGQSPQTSQQIGKGK